MLATSKVYWRLPFVFCLTSFSVFNLLMQPTTGWGDITLPKLFSDHMVLQRNSTVNIWGTAELNQKLTIKFEQTKTSVAVSADAKGNWLATIKTGPAGGPFQLEIAAETGEPKIVLTDVMVGEVWLCSGQSNMEWQVYRAGNPKEEIKNANGLPNLRLFNVDNLTSPAPLADFIKVESWRVCNSKSVTNFSAVAYYFGRELTKHLGDDMPIGLIDSTWGGTPAEAWTSRPALSAVPALAPLLEKWDENGNANSPHRPASLFNAMIAPMDQFKIRGAIWYQGEANNGRGEQYATLLPTLIYDWRKTFGNPELPFYLVQLAPFRYGNNPPSALAEVWEAQLKTWKTVPHTGMVVTTDIGQNNDIHPKNKQEVGRRLALFALGNLYSNELETGQQISTFSGPVYASQTIEGNQIRLKFDHVGDGLKIREPEQSLNEFTICGADQQFVPAVAKIDGDTILVTAADVASPVAVRFGWHDQANPNLINSAGLPASPFRTDSFPLESAGRDF